MNTNSFDQVSGIIKERHTTKAVAMNGHEVSREHIQKLTELADWAPTHGHTEPWRFFIFGGDTLKEFGKWHAEIYWSHTNQENRKQAKYDKLLQSAQNASHLIITVMKRSIDSKIPAREERSAVSAAIQNILLGATALGIATFWSTGGMAYHPALKDYLKVAEEDQIVGLLYLGYSDRPAKKRRRHIPLEEKVIWMK